MNCVFFCKPIFYQSPKSAKNVGGNYDDINGTLKFLRLNNYLIFVSQKVNVKAFKM